MFGRNKIRIFGIPLVYIVAALAIWKFDWVKAQYEKIKEKLKA